MIFAVRERFRNLQMSSLAMLDTCLSPSLSQRMAAAPTIRWRAMRRWFRCCLRMLSIR